MVASTTPMSVTTTVETAQSLMPNIPIVLRSLLMILEMEIVKVYITSKSVIMTVEIVRNITRSTQIAMWSFLNLLAMADVIHMIHTTLKIAAGMEGTANVVMLKVLPGIFMSSLLPLVPSC